MIVDKYKYFSASFLFSLHLVEVTKFLDKNNRLKMKEMISMLRLSYIIMFDITFKVYMLNLSLFQTLYNLQ